MKACRKLVADIKLMKVFWPESGQLAGFSQVQVTLAVVVIKASGEASQPGDENRDESPKP